MTLTDSCVVIFSYVASFGFLSVFALHPAHRAWPSLMTIKLPHFLQNSISFIQRLLVYKGYCFVEQGLCSAWTWSIGVGISCMS